MTTEEYSSTYTVSKGLGDIDGELNVKEMREELHSLVASIVQDKLEHMRHKWAEVNTIVDRTCARPIPSAYTDSMTFMGIGYLLATEPEKLTDLLDQWHKRYGTEEVEGC